MTKPETGSATVELALLIPLLLLLMAMVVEVAVIGRLHVEVVAAAREGARVAATVPDPATALAATTAALGERGEDARVRVHRPHVVGQAARVTVTVVHRIGLPILGGWSMPLSATAVMRVER